MDAVLHGGYRFKGGVLFTVIAGFVCTGCIGCDICGIGKQAHARREFQKVLEENIREAERFAASYSHLGVLEFDIQPDDAVILVDGGEVTLSDDPFFLPVGAHMFEAVWPDGSKTGKTILVLSCTGDSSYEWDYSSSSSSAKGNMKFTMPMKMTKVQLIKPIQ